MKENSNSEDVADKLPCPICEGGGCIETLDAEVMFCPACAGHGEIEPSRRAAIKHGIECRNERRQAGLSIIDAAAAMQLDAADLFLMENGWQAPPNDWAQPDGHAYAAALIETALGRREFYGLRVHTHECDRCATLLAMFQDAAERQDDQFLTAFSS